MKEIQIFIPLKGSELCDTVQTLHTESLFFLYNKSLINKNRMLSCTLESISAVLGTAERLSDNTKETPNALYDIQYISGLK